MRGPSPAHSALAVGSVVLMFHGGYAALLFLGASVERFRRPEKVHSGSKAGQTPFALLS